MNTNRLSKTMAAALNVQMTKEAHASQIYLSYAAWADRQGFEGIPTSSSGMHRRRETI